MRKAVSRQLGYPPLAPPPRHCEPASLTSGGRQGGAWDDAAGKSVAEEHYHHSPGAQMLVGHRDLEPWRWARRWASAKAGVR